MNTEIVLSPAKVNGVTRLDSMNVRKLSVRDLIDKFDCGEPCAEMKPAQVGAELVARPRPKPIKHCETGQQSIKHFFYNKTDKGKLGELSNSKL